MQGDQYGEFVNRYWDSKGLTYNHLSHVGDIDVCTQAMR